MTPPDAGMAGSPIDRTLIQQCAADGAEGVTQMIADVKTLAELFRQHDMGPANHGLVQLAPNLKALIVLVQSLREPVGEMQADLLAVLPSDQDVEALVGLLESLVAAQLGHDWLTVSDVLDYDLEPALRGWLDKLEALKRRCGP